jgi:predicted ArsR family transcriptional regulator
MQSPGLLECRFGARAVGRPRHEWTVVPAAAASRRRSDSRLGAWLARALREGGDLTAVERTGREIGREIAPDRTGGASEEAMRRALDGLGFAPSAETRPSGVRFVLGHCPYRDAVRENHAVVCTLHRGITRGLLDRLAPDAELTGFVAKDPDTAGCEIELGATA